MDSTLACASASTVIGAGSSARRLAVLAMLLAVASVLGLVEAALPPLAFVPWLRLGLANIAVLVTLRLWGPYPALVVSLGRVAIVALATGTLASPVFVISVTGAVVSVAIMATLARFLPGTTEIGISAAGSAAHVVAQFAAAGMLLQTTSLLALAPPSVLAALMLGALTGLIAGRVVSRLVGR